MLKNLGIGLALFTAFVFLGLNIAYSQLISPLYFRQVIDEKNSIVAYLKSIRTLPTFQHDLILYKNLYGREIEDQVFYDESVRREKIRQLEALLVKNTNSRDTLYNLYLLYSQAGDDSKALEHLNKAKQIDPAL